MNLEGQDLIVSVNIDCISTFPGKWHLVAILTSQGALFNTINNISIILKSDLIQFYIHWCKISTITGSKYHMSTFIFRTVNAFFHYYLVRHSMTTIVIPECRNHNQTGYRYINPFRSCNIPTDIILGNGYCCINLEACTATISNGQLITIMIC